MNTISPGPIDTPMLRNSFARGSLSMESAQAKTLMGRFGTVEEVAAMVGWLCTEDCSFSTGAVFDLSGGRSTY